MILISYVVYRAQLGIASQVTIHWLHSLKSSIFLQIMVQYTCKKKSHQRVCGVRLISKDFE